MSLHRQTPRNDHIWLNTMRIPTHFDIISSVNCLLAKCVRKSMGASSINKKVSV